MRLIRASFLGFALIILPLSSVLGHDFWIEPFTYKPTVGDRLPISLRVGEAFDGERYKRNPRHIKEFFLKGPSGTIEVDGQPGAEPAGQVVINGPGVQIIGYHSAHTITELPAGRFENYLQEEHLDNVIRSRRLSGTSKQPGREAFARYAKSILQSGKNTDDENGHEQFLGFSLELIPRQNPYTLSAGEEITILVNYLNQPLQGARVLAYSANDRDNPLVGVSDSKGEVTFRLPLAGPWLIRSLHIVEAVEIPNVDWESFWASLTFSIPGA
jgi:uncharacterized GH25 family protein